jgi:LacI family transcriptional regulator
MADIARRLGVSQATVSYVLNDPNTELVGTAMRERVMATAREMGYRPNRVAQALKGRPSYLIELFVHGYYPAFYARMLYEFAEQIEPTPYRLYIVQWPHDTDNVEALDSGWPVDGVVICDAELSESAMSSLKRRGVPVVALGLSPARDVDHVSIDVRSALLEAMHHLTALGKRVAFLSPWEAEIALAIGELRYLAYREVIKAAGLQEEVIVTPDRSGPGTREIAREIIHQHVREHGCPNAIFCFNDERAIATLDALRDLNYRVPEDVLLIGQDGIDETAYHSPRLSTIEYPITEAARLAWEFLQRRIEQPGLPLQSVTLTARLLLRESSAR